MRAWLALLMLAAAPVAQAQTPQVRAGAMAVTADDVEGSLPAFVRGQLERRKIAGAVVVLVNDGVVLLEEGYGLADVALQRPMDRHTPMRIGSVTKLITALAVMQLADEGRLALDADVNRYLDFTVPSSPGRAPVTLRRLLSHQSAFADRIGGIAASSDRPLPLGEFLATREVSRARLRDGVVAYANYNATLAARSVERVSGQAFERYVDEHIFKPLGMTRTTAMQPAPDSWQVASAYVRSDAPPTRVSMAADPILEVGSTGVVASAADMALLLRALLAPEPIIVSRRALDEMTAPQARVPLGMMGLGMYSPLGMGGNPFVGHDGGTGSFGSVLAFLPREGFGLFASYNSDGTPQALSATAELLQFVAGRYFSGERPPASSSRVTAGTYAPTRGVASSAFRLRQLLQQIAVSSTEGKASIGPAFLPFRQPLERVAPGLFLWAGRDVAFAGAGDESLMQIGAPPGMFHRVAWWENAGVVVPVVGLCLVTAVVTTALWLIGLVRSLIRGVRLTADFSTSPCGVRLTADPTIVVTRVALLLHTGALLSALWLVFAAWPQVAWSSPWVMPVTLATYAAAWMAILLTPVAAWRSLSFARASGGAGVMVRETVLAAMLVVLSLFSLYWRIAGTTLDL